MSCAQTMQNVIEELAELFGEATDMSELDAADFVDNAAKIWELRQKAKEIVEENS